jgi:hypothetical protein
MRYMGLLSGMSFFLSVLLTLHIFVLSVVLDPVPTGAGSGVERKEES